MQTLRLTRSYRAFLVTGWIYWLYLLYAQGLAAFSYDLGISLGTQEHAIRITEVGTAIWWAFAFADALVYIPLLAAGLLGHAYKKRWGKTALAAALGITVYWPVVSLAFIVDARGAEGWHLTGEPAYWVTLPLITLWAIWGFRLLLQDKNS